MGKKLQQVMGNFPPQASRAITGGGTALPAVNESFKNQSFNQ